MLGAGPPPAATRPFPAAYTERLARLPAQMAAVSPRGPLPNAPRSQQRPRRGGGTALPPSALSPLQPSALGAHLVPARAAGGIGQQGGGLGGGRLASPARCPRAALRRAPPRGGRGERGEGEESAPPRPAPPRLAAPRPARVTTPRRAALRRRPATGR